MKRLWRQVWMPWGGFAVRAPYAHEPQVKYVLTVHRCWTREQALMWQLRWSLAHPFGRAYVRRAADLPK